MNSFSFNRFFKTLRWVISVNRLGLLGVTLGFFVAIFLMEVIVAYTGTAPGDFIRKAAGMALWGLIAYLGVCVSSMFTKFMQVGTKPQRSAFLMLPVSNLEKFLAMVFYATVVCTACAFVAVVAGDLLRMCWFWAREAYEGSMGYVYYPDTGEAWHWWSSALPTMYADVKSMFVMREDTNFILTTSYEVMQAVDFTAFCLWIHSLYTLGGTLLRRHAFVISSLVFILCMVLFVQFTQHFELDMFRSEWDGDRYITQEVGVMVYVLAVALPLLSILNYWTSFRIFKNFELISNKWTNYDILKR